MLSLVSTISACRKAYGGGLLLGDGFIEDFAFNYISAIANSLRWKEVSNKCVQLLLALFILSTTDMCAGLCEYIQKKYC